MSFALVIIGLIVIIMVHELGHFLAAKAVGVRATKFYLFFPPKLASIKRGEVEYGVGWIPLGGFVKLPGMFEPRGRESWWRIESLVEDLLAGVPDDDLRLRINDAAHGLEGAPNAAFVSKHCEALIALIEEAITARGENAPALSSGMPDSAWRRRMARLTERLAGIVDDAHPKAYWRADLWRRMVVIAAGPLINILLAFAILWVVAMVHDPVPKYTAYVGSVLKSSPAAAEDIKRGDAILRWNTVKLDGSSRQVERFINSVKAGHGEPVDVTLKRDATTRTIHLAPRTITDPDTHKQVRRVGIGLALNEQVDHYRTNNPVAAARIAGNLTWLNTKYSVTSIRDRFVERNFKGVHSVVGIVQFGPKVQREGVMWHYIAVVSLAIAIMNLLPILPLDGGHLIFGFLEFLRRGRPVPRGVFERASLIGLVLMLSVFWAGLRNDLGLGG